MCSWQLSQPDWQQNPRDEPVRQCRRDQQRQGVHDITTGRFLPVPGSPPAEGKAGPVALSAADTRGVYAADVTFDKPGYWGVLVTAGREALVALSVAPPPCAA